MPNRIIKESVKQSHQIDRLSWFEEVVFYRMIVTADDYGCLDGRIVFLKSILFPTRENVTKKAIEDAVSNLVSAGLLRSYYVDGRPYLFFPTWAKHQRIRNKYRKYPEPPETDATASSCQMSASCLSESNTIQSESNTNKNPNAGAYVAIISYLNEKAGTAYKHTSKATQSHINARLGEGYTVNDFCTVIDKKCEEWRGTEFEKFLRPETLFGSKFDGYLNAPIYTANGRRTVPEYTTNDFFEYLESYDTDKETKNE
ncbi:MAG: conserved phage C-terminal domain-containing protein [Clostridia bacterium]|nr:conserved phage C-terminal domain-containing protein [Clostridia bacterium]